jgi:phenylacetate-CoA ligase
VFRRAYDRSPYYRETFDQHGITPDDVMGVHDLPKLPLLLRDTVRSRNLELRTSGKPRRGWLHGHTSGTTGTPLSMWYDRATCIMTNAADLRQKAWGGMRPGDWIGLLLGRVIVPTAQINPPFWRANHVQRQVWFSSFHLNEGNLHSYVAEIRRGKLRFLEGYPSTLFILAKHVLRQGIELPMQAVFTSSETLHDVQRETIERAFNCRIHDFYGLAERVIFAGECEAHEGKHLAEEYGYTEVVNEAGQTVPDGTVGYLVGTSLHNSAMPMIRYRTSDLSAIRRERCSCGRTLLRMDNVATKAEDIVVTPDGRMISPSVLTHPFKPFDQLSKSQVIQERLDHIRVKLVPSDDFTRSHEQLLVGGLKARLGPSVEIEVEIVTDIPPEPSGKFRWVISRVDHACRFSWSN